MFCGTPCRIQIYIDDIEFYKDENDGNKATPDNRSFIDTSNILSNMISERDIPENPEVDIKDNGDNNEESNEGSRDHKADSIEKISS